MLLNNFSSDLMLLNNCSSDLKMNASFRRKHCQSDSQCCDNCLKLRTFFVFEIWIENTCEMEDASEDLHNIEVLLPGMELDGYNADEDWIWRKSPETARKAVKSCFCYFCLPSIMKKTRIILWSLSKIIFFHIFYHCMRFILWIICTLTHSNKAYRHTMGNYCPIVFGSTTVQRCTAYAVTNFYLIPG